MLFTSESVSEGHPDKLADQISDAVLDLFLAADPLAKVACETLVARDLVVVAGEFGTTQVGLCDELFDRIPGIARQVLRDVGYDASFPGIDPENCEIRLACHRQSPDIRQGVERNSERAQGAGDQGLMFGYATDETDVLMPAPIILAHRLVRRQAQMRKNGELPWLRPDAKSQVTLVYEEGRPVAIDAMVLSTQHSPEIDNKALHDGVMDAIVKPVLEPTGWLGKRTRYHINPTGRFEIGGPVGDCGLTGRKIIVDTYGGMARHGGGAFSGKDPSKVDRSGAYAARYVAKNVVAAGLARRCEIQMSYAIGVADPTSISIETFGTGVLPEDQLLRLVQEHFLLTPYGIRELLDLQRPVYRPTAAYGHFGREEPGFTWERTGAEVIAPD